MFSDPRTSWDNQHQRYQGEPGTWRPVEFWERQELFKRGMQDPEWWLSLPATNLVTGHTQGRFPYQMCLPASCEFAMRMTITIDLLQKVKFRICAREDCTAPFAVTDPRKKFCTQDCAHLVSVREQRNKAKRGKGQRNSRLSGNKHK
jgi:hypothetical protein